VGAERFERVHHRRLLRRRLDVRVEDVLPRASRTGPRLELREVEVALGERSETAIERARHVPDAEDER
jgi:hypothetical protein